MCYEEKPIEEFDMGDDKTLRIFTDSDPQDPRSEWDNFGTMVCFHTRYNLGDNVDLNSDDFNSWDELEEYLEDEIGATHILPLYLYDHSGITISTSSFQCNWDSGRVGFIYCTAKDVEGLGPDWQTEEHVYNILRGEVETYDQYLTGDIYSFEVVQEEGCSYCGHTHEEQLDSCHGFYGTDWRENGLFEQAGYQPPIEVSA